MNEKNLQELKKEYEQIEMTKEQIEMLKKSISNAKNEKKKNKRYIWKISAAAAAAALILIPNISKEAAYAMSNIPFFGKIMEVVTFRDYKYEDERHSADIDVPELIAEQPEETERTDPKTQQNLKKSTDEINAEIQEITDNIIAEFEEEIKNKEGYQDVIVQHETLTANEDYFALKLICYQGAGSGAEWDYFYTIDLKTGNRLALKDLFTDEADYITAISENIKEQMKAQMDADENVVYWLDNKDIPEWNFQKITDETSFYLNDDGNIVICFNEGDVAPMYMGCVEFVIPNEVLENIRKQ